MGWGSGEGLVIAAKRKTKLAPTCTLIHISELILKMAANRAGSASQQSVSSLLNEAIRLLSDERMTEIQSDQERGRSERVAANFR